MGGGGGGGGGRGIMSAASAGPARSPANRVDAIKTFRMVRAPFSDLITGTRIHTRATSRADPQIDSSCYAPNVGVPMLKRPQQRENGGQSTDTCVAERQSRRDGGTPPPIIV